MASTRRMPRHRSRRPRRARSDSTGCSRRCAIWISSRGIPSCKRAHSATSPNASRRTRPPGSGVVRSTVPWRVPSIIRDTAAPPPIRTKDWAGVVKSMAAVPSERADAALARYDAALKRWGPGESGILDDATLDENQRFANGLADRAAHFVRGAAPRLTRSFSVAMVDDDIGGPYTIPPRNVFHAAVRAGGARLIPGRRPGGSRIVLVYAEPRSWKGRADLGPESLAKLERLVPGASLVILFAHPRLVSQIPRDVPVLCCWHGQALMQRAAARWVTASD